MFKGYCHFLISNFDCRRLLAEAAVKKLDLPTAEAAFVRCSDYSGIQLVKKLTNVTNDQLKRAQVAAYFNDFNDAEKLYLEADRRCLSTFTFLHICIKNKCLSSINLFFFF